MSDLMKVVGIVWYLGERDRDKAMRWDTIQRISFTTREAHRLLRKSHAEKYAKKET
jgi:hypothetical protein